MCKTYMCKTCTTEYAIIVQSYVTMVKYTLNILIITQITTWHKYYSTNCGIHCNILFQLQNMTYKNWLCNHKNLILILKSVTLIRISLGSGETLFLMACCREHCWCSDCQLKRKLNNWLLCCNFTLLTKHLSRLEMPIKTRTRSVATKCKIVQKVSKDDDSDSTLPVKK